MNFQMIMASDRPISMKPSAANFSSPKPLDVPLTFFIDRDLGKKIASFLREAGLSVEIHDDHFRQDAEDIEWLLGVGARGWIVLTKNIRIRYSPLELDAVKAAKARVFVLRVKNISSREMADAYLSAMPKIQRMVKKHSPPFIARVGHDGAVSLSYPRKASGTG